MLPFIIGILRTVGTAATGYWLNDVGTWLANVTGLGSKVVAPSGKGFAWWWVLCVAVILAAAVALVIYFISMLAPSRRAYKRKRK